MTLWPGDAASGRNIVKANSDQQARNVIGSLARALRARRQFAARTAGLMGSLALTTPARSERRFLRRALLGVDQSAMLDGPVLLVDDMVDSRWTFTVAARLLRHYGSGEVWPLALADASTQ